MKKENLHRFTEEERAFAEKNHNLVYAFLHTYKYSVSECYHVVVFGFLKAVQEYHRNENLRKQYDFQYIAWQQMRSEIGNYFKIENAKKRRPEHGTVSLDDYSENKDFHNSIGGKSAEDDVMEIEQIKNVLESLSDNQRKIVCMKADGYSPKEILVFLELPSSTYYKEMERIKAVVEKIMND